jgi:hypothetical protein
VIYFGFALMVLVLSELASNTAVATMSMPIAASLAHAVDQPPILLMYVAAFAASAGFALPIATPPNTIVFGSGQVTVRQMARAGILLDAVAIIDRDSISPSRPSLCRETHRALACAGATGASVRRHPSSRAHHACGSARQTPAQDQRDKAE